MRALAARQGSAAVAARRAAAAQRPLPLPAAATTAAATPLLALASPSCSSCGGGPLRRRGPSPSLLVVAAAPPGGGGGHGHGKAGGGRSAHPPPLPTAAASAAPSSVSAKAPPPKPPLAQAPSEAPSLFGMLSSLWPVGGAAAKRAERDEAERVAPQLIKEMSSRLELDAELEACAAPGAPPLVVVFGTAWCGPCKLLIEDLTKAVARRGPTGLRVVKVDVEQEEGGLAELASALKISKLPTAMFCGGQGGGKAAVRTTGLLRRTVVDDLIDNRAAYLGTNLAKAANY